VHTLYKYTQARLVVMIALFALTAPYLDPVPRVANYAYSHNRQASMDNE